MVTACSPHREVLWMPPTSKMPMPMKEWGKAMRRHGLTGLHRTLRASISRHPHCLSCRHRASIFSSLSQATKARTSSIARHMRVINLELSRKISRRWTKPVIPDCRAQDLLRKAVQPVVRPPSWVFGRHLIRVIVALASPQTKSRADLATLISTSRITSFRSWSDEARPAIDARVNRATKGMKAISRPVQWAAGTTVTGVPTDGIRGPHG